MCPKYANAPALCSFPYGNNYFPNAQTDLLYILTPNRTPRAYPGVTSTDLKV